MFRKSILIFTLVSALAANIAFANTSETQVNTQVSQLAGIKAESVLHPVDQAIEKLQILLTADGESKANLLNSISQERIAELKILNEKHKQKFVYKLIKNYLHTVERLDKQLQIASEKEEDIQNLIKVLNQQQSEISKILSEAVNELPTMEQNEIKPKIEEAKEDQKEAIEVIEIVETENNDESIEIEDAVEKTEETPEQSKQESRSEQYQRVQKQSHGKAKAYGLIKNNKNELTKEDENDEKKVKKEKVNKKKLKELKKEKGNKKELKKNEK